MTDVVTVLRKEVLEWACDLRVNRAAYLQIAVIISFLGVYLPFTQPALWVNPTVPTALTPLFFIFPSILTASVAADAFAGERERKTLETLFSTPLRDSAIFYGKAAWAVFYSLAITFLALACGVITALLRAQSASHVVAAAPLFGAAATALAGSVMTAAAAVVISSRVAVAKSAQQLTTLFTMASAAAVVGLIRLNGMPLQWRVLCLYDLVFFAAGLLALAAAALSFRRDRLFDRR
ncbi:MAG TPA: ABC transporter permease [Myxococcales bacterium]